MLWFFVGHIFSVLLSLVRISHLSKTTTTEKSSSSAIKALTNNPPFPELNQSQRVMSNVVKSWAASSMIIILLPTQRPFPSLKLG